MSRCARSRSAIASSSGRPCSVARAITSRNMVSASSRRPAGALALAGRREEAETMFRDVIARATEHGRPLLLAMAERDLAHLLIQIGDAPGGKAAAQRARSSFQRLSARAEIDKLDELLETA